jgi:hypothetical protein
MASFGFNGIETSVLLPGKWEVLVNPLRLISFSFVEM